MRPFFLFALFVGDPSSSPFLGTFPPFSPPRKVLCSVEERAQYRAWRGAVSGWTSPKSSGRKFLPEIRVAKRTHAVLHYETTYEQCSRILAKFPVLQNCLQP